MFRFSGSVVLWGGRGAADNITGVCGEHSQCSGHTGFAPAHGVCASPVYTAQAPGCCPGNGPWVACTSQAQAAQVQVSGYSTKAQTQLGLRFVPSPARAAQGIRSLSAHSPRVRCALSPPCPRLSFRVRRLSAPCVSSGELISGCDPRSGCQPSRISGSLWLETGGLFAVW